MAKSRRRELVKERHKREIIEVAIQLFGRKGYKETTMEEIAETAQFSKGAIYAYFPSKRELFYEILKNVFDRVQTFADDARKMNGDARTKFKAYIINLYNYFLESKDSYYVLLRGIMQMEAEEQEAFRNYLLERVNQIVDVLVEIVKTDIKRGRIKNIDPRLIVTAFNGMIRDVIHGCLYGERLRQMNADEIADMVLQILFDGISKNKN